MKQSTTPTLQPETDWALTVDLKGNNWEHDVGEVGVWPTPVRVSDKRRFEKVSAHY